MDGSHPLLRPGEITEIVGPLSSGRTSLVMQVLASLTQAGAVAALVDTDDALDPTAALRVGVDLVRLLWVRCEGHRQRALRAADLLVRCPGFGAVVLDVGETPPCLTLAAAFRLKLAVRAHGLAFLIVGRRRIMGAGAGLAVETSQAGQEWSGSPTRPSRLAAMRTAVRVLRERGEQRVRTVPTASWRWTT